MRIPKIPAFIKIQAGTFALPTAISGAVLIGLGHRVSALTLCGMGAFGSFTTSLLTSRYREDLLDNESRISKIIFYSINCALADLLVTGLGLLIERTFEVILISTIPFSVYFAVHIIAFALSSEFIAPPVLGHMKYYFSSMEPIYIRQSNIPT